MKSQILLIPSFGTDSSLYDNLKLELTNQYIITKAEWINTTKDISLESYARQFIKEYKITNEDILIGTSLGGILAIEISKIVSVKKIISISSMLTRHEQPVLFKFLRFSGIYRLWSPRIAKYLLFVVIPFYGKKVKQFKWFKNVFTKSDNHFLRWGFRQIILWDNEFVPKNLTHIHGEKDPLFPLHNCERADIIIKGGTHAMIRFRAKEIGSKIEEIINKI